MLWDEMNIWLQCALLKHMHMPERPAYTKCTASLNKITYIPE